MTLIGLLTCVPRMSGSTTNSASDGIVYSSPDAGTSTARAPGLRLASQPSGTATTTPITTGTSDSIRCSPSSSAISPTLRGIHSQTTGDPALSGRGHVPPDVVQRAQHVVGGDGTCHAALAVHGDPDPGGRRQRRVERAAQRAAADVVEGTTGHQVPGRDGPGAVALGAVQPPLRV